MRTTAVILSGPRELSLQPLDLVAPKAGDLVVEIAHSGISTGTEKLLYSGRMDTMTIQDGPNAVITVSSENELADLLRPRVRRYNSQDHKTLYPDDNFFDFVENIATEREIKWGQA